MIVDDRAVCQLVSHPSGIYELIWHDVTDDAVEDWLDYMDCLYDVTDPQHLLRVLYTIRSDDLPSLAYVARGVRRLNVKYPERARTRTAIVVGTRMNAGLLQMLARMLHRPQEDVLRFFAPAEANDAVAWLLNAAESHPTGRA